MSERSAIFIDGAYLERVLRDEFKSAKIDFQRLSENIAGDSDVLRTYYYNCPAYQGTPPTDVEKYRYDNQRKFFNRLENLPRYSVRLGRLARRGSPGRYRYEQKMVDILLGVDMVVLAVKGHVRKVILLAGDSDFIPAVSVAKSEGVVVRLAHGQSRHLDLLREADERIPITQELIDSILM